MTPPDRSPDVDRRTALRLGGGALALVLGVGAGWLDRRGDGDGAAPTGSTSPSSTTTTTTTTVPVEVSAELAAAAAAADPGVRTVGHRYLATHPDEADLAGLLAALPGAAADPLVTAATTIRDEFVAGETVVVDGWILARSEARAAAVLALACEGPAC